VCVTEERQEVICTKVTRRGGNGERSRTTDQAGRWTRQENFTSGQGSEKRQQLNAEAVTVREHTTLSGRSGWEGPWGGKLINKTE